MTLEVTKTVEELEQLYDDTIGKDTFGCLIMGERGMGKTTMIGTAPKPILVYMFDPKGSQVLTPLIKEKKCLVIPLWGDKSQEPTKWREFKSFVTEHVETGFLKKFATVAVDSTTFLLEALTHHVSSTAHTLGLEKAIKPRPRNIPFQGDYRIIYQEVIDTIQDFSTQPINLIYTAHLEPEKNELTGDITMDISAYKKLRSFMPAMFTEKYVIRTKPLQTGKDGKKFSPRFIMTQPSGMYNASTQFENMDYEEKPDIKYLMEKAGLDNSDLGNGRYDQ